MDLQRLARKTLPLSETAFYILLSLQRERHGYGIMQDVATLTDGRVQIGAGTLYGTLGKMEKQRIIEATAREERRKLYRLTEVGRKLLALEIQRLEELVRDAHRALEVEHD
jgi:DNA-binding PadR family transcriptional regulator